MAASMPRFRVMALALVILLVVLAALSWKNANFTIGRSSSSASALFYASLFENKLINEKNGGDLKLVEVDTSDFDRSPLPPLDGEQLSERWVVVTTIQKPTEDMRRLGQMAKYGWRVLAVGDRSTPADWQPPPGVRFLSSKEADSLGYNLMRYHKWKVYAAKNVGYMFAIHHGARIIYDTDDDNHPTDELRSMLDLAGVAFDGETGGSKPANLTRALYFAPPNRRGQVPVINPLPHFGQSLLWPRGYPLREIARSPLRSYRLCTTRPPSWIQGVVNGDPDVDAIFRMTRKHARTPINMTFDRAPPVVAPRGFYVQSNSQNTLFTAAAIPFIFLPYTVTMRETDIWRAYIGQRMLWGVGQRKGYVAPNAFQDRNPHDFLKDFRDEMKLYIDVEHLVEALQAWNCDDSMDADACFAATYRYLASSQYSFVLRQDAYAAAAWVADLRRIGFPMPKRGEIEDCLTDQRMVARLYPVEQKTTVPGHAQLVDALGPKRSDHRRSLLHQCARVESLQPPSPNWSPPGLPRVVSLLFGLSSYSRGDDVVAAMKRLDLLYRPYVSRLLFCVPRQFVTDLKCVAVAERYQLSMVESASFDPRTGAPSRSEMATDCLRSAWEMRLDGDTLVYVAADAYVLVTPLGLQKVAATEQELLVGACDSRSKSPLVVAVKREALSQLLSEPTSLRDSCKAVGRQLSVQPCPSSDRNDTGSNAASVLSGCMGFAEDSSLAAECSVFVP